MTRHEQVRTSPNASRQWVISTRELGRRPGNMRTYERTAPAPAEFGLGVIAVPQGSPIALELRLESASEGVFVSGTAQAEVSGECARCLEPIVDEITVHLGELFAYPDSATVATTEADEVSHVVEDMIDTEPLVRDAVLLALPLAPLCQPDCRGLCPDCGERWADLGPAHGHDTMDARWAGLQGRLISVADTDVDTASDGNSRR
jgi:uncharacterized protein